MAGRSTAKHPSVPIVYWDTCAFIEWMSKNPSHGEEDQAALKAMVKRAGNGQLRIITSSLTITEVLESKLEPHIAVAFPELLRREEFLPIDLDRRIAARAAEYRDFYIALEDHDQGHTLSTPDAVHLATAVHHGCDAFYTYDGVSGNTLSSKKGKQTRTLLRLPDPVAGDKLQVVRPRLNTVAVRVEDNLFSPPVAVKDLS